MKGALFVISVMTGAWMLVGGPIGLAFGLAVMEAAVLVASGFGLIMLAALLLLDDLLGPRP